MKNIIFAGGTGKRFWPASRTDSPKQFLSVVGNKPLVRIKYEHLSREFKPEDTFVSTGLKYKKEVEKILPEIPKANFIFEPSMRDTGPAVGLAINYVYNKHPDEIVSILWSDHLIKQPKTFIKALKYAEKIAKETKKVIIIGSPPRFPSPHLGHIKHGERIKAPRLTNKISLYEFVRFVEKPAKEVAKQYLRSGDYCWNLGYFVSHPLVILEKYKQIDPLMYKTLENIRKSNFAAKIMQTFSKLEKISFDYLFAENLTPEEALLLNVEMGWSDVGTWIALKEALQKSDDDVVYHGNTEDLGSKDCIIYNYEKSKLIATMQLKDMIVVNTPDVVAVFHKDDNGKLKDFLKMLEEKGKTQYL